MPDKDDRWYHVRTLISSEWMSSLCSPKIPKWSRHIFNSRWKQTRKVDSEALDWERRSST